MHFFQEPLCVCVWGGSPQLECRGLCTGLPGNWQQARLLASEIK